MAETHFLPDDQGNTARPPLIGTLGVLTFINCGLFIVVYGLGALAMLAVQSMPLDEYREMMESQMAAMPFVEGQEAMVRHVAELLHRSGALLMLIMLVRTVVRLYGAIGIWKGRRTGFHIYAAAQLLGIFAPHIVLPWTMLGVGGPLMTVAMTALYGTQLKRLA